ncbi:MAG: hypothetical protein RIQ47_1801 [Bacteroidota bacterium]|jgi:hypothetical protein
MLDKRGDAGSIFAALRLILKRLVFTAADHLLP